MSGLTPDPTTEISPRQQTILKLIVQEYVASGRPVGSKTLTERYKEIVEQDSGEPFPQEPREQLRAARAAFAAERRAYERLPGDTRALIVIMADVAQGGLNQAVISIEVARGELERAVAIADEFKPGPLPTPGP